MSGLLIAGGSRDPNLAWLKQAADRLGMACECLFFDLERTPGFCWSVDDGAVQVDGRPLAFSSAFMRFDVFEHLTTGKPAAAQQATAWFATLAGLFASADTFTFNRRLDPIAGNKPAMLGLARQAGLNVPTTLVSNVKLATEAVSPGGQAIAKPVGGGSYIVELAEAVQGTDWRDGLSPSPAIVQPRLSYPERRIYRVGRDYFVLDIVSSTLDSRLDRSGSIVQLPAESLSPAVLQGIERLTSRLGCDFCAIDMKTDPETGELVFLELNNGPMFVAYDRATGGAMCEAMLAYLTEAPT